MTSAFSTSYLGPIQYYFLLINSSSSIIEQHCHYTKKTYRNRTNILAANGPLSLTIPITKDASKQKSLTKDIKIAYDTKWQDEHWRSITSAYNSSPYFEYYQDDFAPFYQNKYNYLLDFNMELMEIILSNLDLSLPLVLSNEYVKNYENDYRTLIHPKIDFNEVTPNFKAVPYRQVFEKKYGFTPNLSIIDLLFNKGPESIFYLKKDLLDKVL